MTLSGRGFASLQVVGGNLKVFLEISTTIGGDVVEHVRACMRVCVSVCARMWACVYRCVVYVYSHAFV